MPYDPYPMQTPGQQVLGGLQAFSESVNRLAMQHSIQQAQDQIDNIQASAKNDFDMHQGFRQVGQQLAFQLAAAGADASKIQSVVGAIPREPAPPQNALEAISSENPRLQQIGKDYLSETEGAKAALKESDTAAKIRVAEIQAAAKINAANAKESAKEDAEFRALPDQFGKRKDITPLLEAQNGTKQAQHLLAIGDQVNAATMLLKIGILKGVGLTRQTQTEISSITGNPDWQSGLSRMLSLAAQGHLPAADLANFHKILDAVSSASQESLESKIDDLALAKAKAGSGRYNYDQYRGVMRTAAGFDKPAPGAPVGTSSGSPNSAAPANSDAAKGFNWK